MGFGNFFGLNFMRKEVNLNLNFKHRVIGNV